MAESKQAMELQAKSKGLQAKSRSRETKPTLLKDLSPFTLASLMFIEGVGFSENDSINARHRKTGLTPLMTAILCQNNCSMIMELLQCPDIEVGLTVPSTHSDYPGCNELQILITEILENSRPFGHPVEGRFYSDIPKNNVREIIRCLVEKNKDCLNHIVKDSDISAVAGEVDQEAPLPRAIAAADPFDDEHPVEDNVLAVMQRQAMLGQYVKGMPLLAGMLRTQYAEELEKFLKREAEKPETFEARALERNILSKEMLLKLLVNLGADINQLPPGNIPRTSGMPLFYAIFMRNRKMVECALSLKADPNLFDSEEDFDLLNFLNVMFLNSAESNDPDFSEKNHLEILKLLLKAGAKFYTKGAAVSMYAENSALGHIQQYFASTFEMFASVSDRLRATMGGLSAKIYALHSELTLEPNTKIDTYIRYVVGSDQFFEIVNRVASDGVKARKEDLERLQYLLDQGICVNTVNEKGDTALHLACRQKIGSAELTRLLLKNGANLTIQNDSNETPLDVAMKVVGVKSVEDLIKRNVSYTSKAFPVLINFIQYVIDKEVCTVRQLLWGVGTLPSEILNSIAALRSDQGEMEFYAFTGELKPKKATPAKAKSEADAKSKSESETGSATVTTVCHDFIEECVAKACSSEIVQKIAAKRLMEACLQFEAYKAKKEALDRMPQLSLSASPASPAFEALSKAEEAKYKALCMSFGSAYQAYKKGKP